MPPDALPPALSPSALPADITALAASPLSAAIRERQVSCVEVMQAYLARVHRYNPRYTALVSLLDDDVLLAQAREADADLAAGRYRGWLHGMPIAVKDLANAKGLETSQGSPIFAGTRARSDDVHVARMRDAGALCIGKTNVPEFGLGSQSYNTVFGTTRCAFDPALTAGGSSGGAACALAAHLLPAADGSDMMGSLRNPAAFNNVIGFRPSLGRVPRTPFFGMYPSPLATAGPMGRTVEDTARLLITMAGDDGADALALKDSLPPFSAFAAPDPAACRLGWLGDFDGYLPTEPGVIEVCEAALATFAAAGATVDACPPPFDMARLWQTWRVLRQHTIAAMKPLYNNPRLRPQLKPEAVWEIENGMALTREQVTAAEQGQREWCEALAVALEGFDVLALPTAQVFPFSADVHWPSSINGTPMDTYHRWMEVVIGATLGGNPVVNVPAGFDAGGRPMGMQFVGRVGKDQQVLEMALAYEASTDFLSHRPELRPADAGDEPTSGPGAQNS